MIFILFTSDIKLLKGWEVKS